MERLTLYELNSLVRQTLAYAMPSAYWVEAELSEVRQRGGHCYMELIQKDDRSNTPVAKASARCWRNTWQLLGPHFERVTGQPLRPGMKVLLEVSAQFHENYGFSWIVSDIDPTFTLGDMARKRKEIIRRLQEEGVYDLQRELSLSPFARRVAVISSEGAAGYGDFCHQLAGNESGFSFHTQLFPAVMQGEQVEQSVIRALGSIWDASQQTPFDVVVIIRGGGATSDLSGFDTLALAENVANFPIPVITGIGHERDESVLDLISFRHVKTPTAAAAFLVDNLALTLARVNAAQDTIVDCVRRRMERERLRLHTLSGKIPVLFSMVKTRRTAVLERLSLRLTAAARNRLADQHHRLESLATAATSAANLWLRMARHRLDLLDERLKALDPTLLLRRGYSITLHEGRVVRDPSQLHVGDRLETRLEKGTVESVVS